MTKETLGQRLRRIREEAGMSRFQLCCETRSMTESAINKWEHDRTAPSFFSMVDVAKKLGVSLDYLAGLTEDRNPR